MLISLGYLPVCDINPRAIPRRQFFPLFVTVAFSPASINWRIASETLGIGRCPARPHAAKYKKNPPARRRRHTGGARRTYVTRPGVGTPYASAKDLVITSISLSISAFSARGANVLWQKWSRAQVEARLANIPLRGADL